MRMILHLLRVKEIFKLALTGKGTKKISSILTERKIITPSAYKAQNGDTRFYRYHKEGDDICKWCFQTIRAILTDRVYVGDMVNHKYEVVNYKTRERLAMPLEQQIVVKNTHEAIISKEDYECAQTLLHQRHRPRRHEFDNVFKNLAFCSECGHQ